MKLQKPNTKKAVVIGGGLSGLATAALLGRNGFDVTLIEKNKTLGGRARVFREKGFSFDMGPSWYLMPEVFEQFFALFGKKSSDYYKLIRLNPRYQTIFSDGEKVVLADDIRQNIKWFEEQEKGAGKKLELFLSRMEKIYNTATKQLMYEDVWNPKTWIKKDNITSIFGILGNLQFWQSWDREVARYFKSEKLRQVLEFSAVFLGGSPFNTPALYAILTWADFGKGVWYPEGGMIKVVEALEKLAEENGVKIRTGVEAIEIVVDNKKVAGVKTTDQYLPADVVVGATDLPHVELKLLSPEYRTWGHKYWKKKTMGISALLIYLGINKRIPNLIHHTIYVSNDWQKNFDEVLNEKVLPEDPSFYVSVRSATDRGIVPKDCEEIVVLVPLGPRSYKKTELGKYSDKIIKKLEKVLDRSLVESIVVKKIFTPNDFREDYNAYEGTALGLAHTLGQSLWLRPGNESRKVGGLYYAGQYTNPGVGVPMALISAQIVANLVEQKTEIESDSNQIFKSGSTTYYYSSLFFGGQVKKDVFSLYAYVRVIDDLVDRTHPMLLELEKNWQDTLKVWRGEKISNKVVENFVELAKRKKFEWEWVEAFWIAMRSDLSKKKYNSYQELEKYMYGSAEVIGFMMAKILDLPSKAMKAAALQGKAMQFVNFIRDVREDEEWGRNYLGYTIGQKKDPEIWKTYVQEQIKKFWQLQEEAERGYRYITKKHLIPIKTAAEMYKWTAQQIYQDPALVWKKKLKPHRVRVLFHAIKNSVI